jgi:hypothetical protein
MYIQVFWFDSIVWECSGIVLIYIQSKPLLRVNVGVLFIYLFIFHNFAWWGWFKWNLYKILSNLYLNHRLRLLLACLLAIALELVFEYEQSLQQQE